MADSGISQAAPDRTEKPNRQQVSDKLSAQLPIKELNGFELISKVGQGGMGTVFKARQKSLDRFVALKILPPSIAKNKRFIERFQREARASAKLWHPHIVQGIDVGQDTATGLWYFAMEYVDGPSLCSILKKEKVIPEKRALEILSQIALALQCVYEAGMIHRDIKPDNILINELGLAKLADLGLAKQLINDSAELTQSGQTLGTPNYMAPEQVRGEDDIDIRADFYALGATLFHLVTGQPPFKGGTSAEILSKHLVEAPPLAHKVNPAVSEGCSKFIAKLMEKKRENRVQTPTELRERMAVLLNPESGKTGQRPAVGNKTTSGMRPGVGARASGPRPAVGNRISGMRPGVERGSTALQMPISPDSTGPLYPVDGRSTTGPRASIHARTTGSLNPVTGEVHVIDLASSRPVAKKSSPMIWVCVAALAIIVAVAAALAASTGSKHDETKTTAASSAKATESEKAAPTAPPVLLLSATVKPEHLPNREARAKAALDAAFSLEAQHADDFPALFAAFTDACELSRDTSGGTKASEALLSLENRWTDRFSTTLKGAVEKADAFSAKGEFAAAFDVLKDDAIAANLRIRDWAVQLDARRKTIRDAAETAATKILDDAHALAQPGTVAALESAIEKAKLAESIPVALAPSAAKAAQERAGYASALADLKKKAEDGLKAQFEQAKTLIAGVHKDLAPLEQQSRFSAASELLEKKLHEPALGPAAALLQAEKSELTTIIALRQRALDALRAMKGKNVTLKKGKGTLSGTIAGEQLLAGVTLALGDGPELTIAPDQLDARDIDTFAPPAADKGDDLRCRGLLYLAQGEANKAREFFKSAHSSGFAGDLTQYLERADILELGEVEVRAQKEFADAEALFAAKKFKEAQLAYQAFSAAFSKTKCFAAVSAQIKEHLGALERILNPIAPGLTGNYYRGSKFEGQPLLTRVDAKIDFDWSGQGPSNEIGHDNYCVRWEGEVKIPKAGHYTFVTVSDDGVRLWIDGKQLIDQWGIFPPTRFQAERDLTEGQHELKLEYFQAGGGASCRFYWAQQDGFKEELVPADALLHQAKK